MKECNIMIRVKEQDKIIIENNAKKFGFNSTSEYLRYLGKNCKEINIKIEENDN
jgi:hypothetical protein